MAGAGSACRLDGTAIVQRGGAQNGIRTRDLILTKDVLCQLSYLGPRNGAGDGAPMTDFGVRLEPTTGLEPGTGGLQNRCSTN